VAAFDLDDDTFCFARSVINKNLNTVDALVRTFLAGSPNASLQLRRALSIRPEGKRLLEKDAIAPSAARLC